MRSEEITPAARDSLEQSRPTTQPPIAGQPCTPKCGRRTRCWRVHAGSSPNRTLACLLAGCVIGAAQTPVQAWRGGIELSDVAGTWEGKSMVGPNDSVFATWVLTATADGKGWTEKFPHRDPYPQRIM